jgi:hypothetical protein
VQLVSDGTRCRSQHRAAAAVRVIVVVGLINLGIAVTSAEVVFGQTAWPVTYTVVEVTSSQFTLFFMVLIALFAGELVWRERELGADQIVDALPGQTSATMVGKFLGLVLVEGALLAFLMGAGMLYQLASGYSRFEPFLYITFLFGTVLPSLVQLTALAVLIHVVANQKYLGHALVIFALILRMLAPTMGLEHPLTRFAVVAPFRYSDMNGYGPYVPGLVWTTLYWSAVAVLLGVVAYLTWVRGSEPSWQVRRRAAAQRWRGATRGVAFGALGVGAVTSASSSTTPIVSIAGRARRPSATRRRTTRRRTRRSHACRSHAS